MRLEGDAGMAGQRSRQLVGQARVEDVDVVGAEFDARLDDEGDDAAEGGVKAAPHNTGAMDCQGHDNKRSALL